MNTANVSPNQNHIRVLLAHLPETIVLSLKREFDIRANIVLVSSVHDDIRLLFQASQGVDVVVLGASCTARPPGIVSHLLTQMPGLRIIVLQVQDDRVVEYWLGLRQRRSHPKKISQLADVICQLYERDIME